nr:MAG TPA: hypothetical protein [Caudoviricetes sp.]
MTIRFYLLDMSMSLNPVMFLNGWELILIG